MLVAVTCDRRLGRPGPGPRVRPGRPEVFVSEHVVDHLRAVGLTPILLPPGGMRIDLVTGVVGGVVITGGNFDIHPKHYGQPVTWSGFGSGEDDGPGEDGAPGPGGPGGGRVDEARTGLELALIRECAKKRIPTLGICGGMQAMAVALGGQLIQDLGTDAARRGATLLEHEQAHDPCQPAHDLVCEPGWEWLRGTGERAEGCVNSTHHQAVDPEHLGKVRVVARAPDGVIEAIAHHDGVMLGVEWHPELLAGPGACPVFNAFASAVGHAAWSVAIRSKGRFSLPPGSLP